MDKKEKNSQVSDTAVAPGIDPEDSYGRDATKAAIKKGESTKVTRFVYDEYDPSKKL
jgi:hypothetical protein